MDGLINCHLPKKEARSFGAPARGRQQPARQLQLICAARCRCGPEACSSLQAAPIHSLFFPQY